MKSYFRILAASLTSRKRLARPTLAIICLALPASVALGVGLAVANAQNVQDNGSADQPGTSSIKTELNQTSHTETSQPEAGADSSSVSSADQHTTTSQTTVTSNTTDGQTEVTVNGQKIAVPANGEIHKTITSDNGQTSVDVQVSGNGASSAGNSSSSSINLNVSSNSSSGD